MRVYSCWLNKPQIILRLQLLRFVIEKNYRFMQTNGLKYRIVHFISTCFPIECNVNSRISSIFCVFCSVECFVYTRLFGLFG